MNQKESQLDLRFLKDFCRNDKKRMIQYIHTFLESAPEQVELIRNAGRQHDWKKVQQAVHALKPQANFIGLTALGNLTLEMESLSKQENISQEFDRLMIRLEGLMESGSEELIQSLLTLA